MDVRLAIPGDECAIAEVHVESWKTTYQGIVDENYLQSLSKSSRAEMWKGVIERGFNESCLFVALIDGKVVGFASGGPERTKKYGIDTELYAIYLLKENQGRGIGKKLIQEVASFLMEKDHSSMLVWVLTENPCKHFYLSFCPEELDTEQIKIGENSYEETAYVWKDLRKLIREG
jgi:GNAT superfamily N-acetyltransferase